MLLEYFNSLLKKLGTNIGLTGLSANSYGFCSLRFDDRLTIDLECNEEQEKLIISSLIGTMITEQKEKFFSELLEANLLWGGTGGATIGVDPATLAVFICYQERLAGMEFSRFQELIKEFSDTALFWNQRLVKNTPKKDRKRVCS
ncbi:MAG: type III secretion system chaperone [Chthoniobacterales bacterium]